MYAIFSHKSFLFLFVGGGQDEMSVDYEDHHAGQLEAKFYHNLGSFLVGILINYSIRVCFVYLSCF